MAKHLDPRISGLSFDKEDHPGCLWGVLHVFRSYQWTNVKRLMPNKKSGGRRQTAGMRYSRLRLNNLNAGEPQGLLDSDGDDMNMRDMLHSSTTSRSRKSQDNIPSRTNSRSYLGRTESFHRIDPSSHMLPDEVREVARCNSSGCKWNPYLLKTSSLPASCCNNCEMCPTTSSSKSMSYTQLDDAQEKEELSTQRSMFASSSSSSPVAELRKRSFKDIKRKIKNIIKEGRKEGNRIYMDALFHKVPYGSKEVKREMTNKLKKGGINNIRRTQSLNESLNRYSQLLELRDGGETKQLYSRSLKLGNESAGSSLGSTPKALGRLLSLPNLGLNQSDESRDALAVRAVNSDNVVPMDETGSMNKDQMELISDEIKDTVSQTEQEIRPENNADTNQSVLEVEKKDEADFNYVKDVLKLSGFIGHESLGTWYSPEQPVDPALFEEVETFSPLKSDYSENEHQLLFDMINEVLLEIYDRSFTYWPLALSSNCHIRPMPLGRYVLEGVWGIISWYLNSQPEFESLDYLAVRDLSKNDGWMNIQVDSECVGIELEEMILDDLLDEMLYE